MIKNRGNLICDDLNKPSSKNTKPSEFENENNRTHRWAILFLAVIATLFITGCASNAPLDTLDPAGRKSTDIKNLINPILSLIHI